MTVLPLVAHQATAAARSVQDDPGGSCAAGAVGIAQVHARQAHLARIQQHVAVFVVDKEVAVLAELHARQRIQRLAPLQGWLLAAGLDARQRRGRQLHVVPQLGLLAVQVGGLDQLSFLTGQLQCLVLHGHRDQAQGQRDGGNRQKRKFQRKLHGSLCGCTDDLFRPVHGPCQQGLRAWRRGPAADLEWRASYLPIARAAYPRAQEKEFEYPKENAMDNIFRARKNIPLT